MKDYNELEIELQSLDAENYRITLRLTKGVADLGTPQEVGPADIAIDRQALLQALNDFNFADYGNQLRDALFALPDIHALFVTAFSNTPLRIKLKLDPTNPELHSLRWELLTGPDNAVLSSKEGIALSRYLPSGREVSLRRESDDLRALIVVVDLSVEDRERLKLSEIDVEYEKRAASLSPIECHGLTSDEGPVTMNKVVAKLKAGAEEFGGYDILYLVCHGTMGRDGQRPFLLFDLETEEEQQNRAYFRSGEVFVRRLAEEVSTLPRLVLLASCASAGTGEDNALSALGPLLAAQGVPAVIAMQGFVQLKTIDAFIPAFFQSLNRNGEVDRAMRDARSQVKNELNYEDWWMPALFMRLATGRIWYTPGFDVQAAIVQEVYFSPDEEVSFFMVEYKHAPGEMRSTADGQLLGQLSGDVNWVDFSPEDDASFLVISYEDGRSELWATDNFTRLADLGFNVTENLFSPGNETLTITYDNGRVDELSIEELVDLACEYPLSRGLFDESELEKYGIDDPQACR